MKKHKFTWIDGLILAIVVLLIAGTCFKFFSNDSAASVTQENVEFQCQIKIAGVRKYTTDGLQVGDTVFDGEAGGAAMGVIRDIAIVPGVDAYESSDGRMIAAETEGRYDVTLTLDCSGAAAGNTYKNGAYTYYTNLESTFNTKYTTWTGTIISID